MGLITNLIAAHDEKKRKDKAEQMKGMMTLYQMPEGMVSDKVRQWAFENFSALAGDSLGIPKKSHGMLGQILTGMGTLNPYPKKDKLPDSDRPKGGLLGTEETKAYRQGREQEAREGAVKDEQTEFAEKQRQAAKVRDERLELLKQNKDLYTPEEYAEVYSNIAFGTKLPAGRLSMMKRTNVVLGFPDGTQQAALQDAQGHFWDATTDEEIIPPPGYRVIPQQKTASADPADWRRRIKQYTSAGFSDQEAAKMASWYFNNVDAINLGNARLRGQRTSQETQIQGEMSGDYGRMQGIPPPPFLGPGRPNPNYKGETGAPTAPGAAAGVTTTTPVTAVPVAPAPAASVPTTAVRPTKTAGKPKAAAAPKTQAAAPATTPQTVNGHKVVSPVAVEDLVKRDRQASLAYDSLMQVGAKGGMMGGGAMRLGIDKGIQKLVNLTGLTRPDLQVEATGREADKKALGFQREAKAAYDRAANMTDQMGKAALEARKKFGDDPVFWQKAINNMNRRFVGDPDTDALVLAVQGFSSAYSRAIAGGQMSRGQTPVYAQELAGHQLDINMRPESFDSVIKQAGIELGGEKKAIDDTISGLQKNIQRPFGAYAHPEWFEEKKEDKPQIRLQQNSKGEYRHSTDGGKTWQPGKPK